MAQTVANTVRTDVNEKLYQYEEEKGKGLPPCHSPTSLPVLDSLMRQEEERNLEGKKQSCSYL